MSKFPMIPIGTVCCVEVLPDNLKGGIILPDGGLNRSFSACKVLVPGDGELVATGERAPLRCKEGDMILCLSGTLAKIDHGVRGHLVERGVKPEYLDHVAMVQYENILAILPPVEAAKNDEIPY